MSLNNSLPPNPSQPPKALIVALKKVLRPLVRMLLAFQITLPYLIELLKEIYVDIAEKDFRLEDKKQTDTRISLLTGVHRKDTRRLRNQETEREESPAAVSVGVQLVSRWISDPLYLDPQGKPRPLALKKDTKDSAPDFEHLVQSVCKQDMRARVVLDEWLRLGIAKVVDKNWVELNSHAFVPSSGLEEKAFYLGMNISDHLEAASRNLLVDKPPFLERCVYYDGLSPAAIEELKADAEEQGMALLQALNKKALSLKAQALSNQSRQAQSLLTPTPQDSDTELALTENQAPEAKTAPLQRMNFGLYFFSQPGKSDDEAQ